MPPPIDYHVHSTYSDGGFLDGMIGAAEDAGLAGLGFADHCNVSDSAAQEAEKYRHGFSFDITYDRRRSAIRELREETDLRLFDGVEMDYDPRDERAIAAFLSDADFEYTIGSVHHVDDRNVNKWGLFAGDSEAEREAVVAEYFENLIALVDSELFDVVSHVDLVERNPHLRGIASRPEYERVAEALGRSRTVPEVNAGKVLADYGEFHPRPAFLDVLTEHGTEFTIGTDAHDPDQLRDRMPELTALFEDRGFRPVRVLE